MWRGSDVMLSQSSHWAFGHCRCRLSTFMCKEMLWQLETDSRKRQLMYRQGEKCWNDIYSSSIGRVTCHECVYEIWKGLEDVACLSKHTNWTNIRTEWTKKLLSNTNDSQPSQDNNAFTSSSHRPKGLTLGFILTVYLDGCFYFSPKDCQEVHQEVQTSPLWPLRPCCWELEKAKGYWLLCQTSFQRYHPTTKDWLPYQQED